MPRTSDGAGRGAPVKCRTCHRPMNTPLVCDACRTLYPADGLTHFELLGLPADYDIAPDDLRRRYLTLSRQTHPDARLDDDPGLALRNSAQLNEAYRVLADPVLRAEYLLELSGGRSAADEKSVSQDVLTQTLLLREELEEADHAGDAAARDAIRRQIVALRSAAEARIATLARALPGDESLRRTLRQTLNAMRYYQKLAAELRPA